MSKPSSQGRIKSFDAERMLGLIESRGIPGEISVSSSVVESKGNGLQELVEGEKIEFRYDETPGEEMPYRATWVRRSPCRGKVKFFNDEKGWGGIESDQTPGDVWVIWSVIDGTGYRNLTPGEEVEFLYERADQDSWRYRATWVRQLAEASGR
jgi:CspA family cold shock protein